MDNLVAYRDSKNGGPLLGQKGVSFTDYSIVGSILGGPG